MAERQINTRRISDMGATTGQAMIWDGDYWTPTTIPTPVQVTGSTSLANSATYELSHSAGVPIPLSVCEAVQNWGSSTKLVANWTNSKDADTGQTCSLTGNAGVSSGAMQFDGSGDFADFPDSSDYTLGTSNFCIEFEVKFNSLSGNQHIVNHSTDGAGEGAAPYAWAFYLSSGAVRIGVEGWSIIGGDAIGTPSTGTWYHVAVNRSGNTFRWYWNGTLVSSTTNSGTINDRAGTIKFGRAVSGIENFNGSIRRFRMTVGSAVYGGSSFTPPSSDYSPVSTTYTELTHGTHYTLTHDASGSHVTNTSGSTKNIYVTGVYIA